MIESTVIGAVIGAASRAAPEALRYLDRHLDRRHELAMQQIALEFTKASPGMAKSMEFPAGMSGAETATALDALKEAWRQQFATGDKRIDLVSILVRPCVTYALITLYAVVKLFMLGAAAAGKLPWAEAYGENDLAFMSGIMSFWFLGRVWDKKP